MQELVDKIHGAQQRSPHQTIDQKLKKINNKRRMSLCHGNTSSNKKGYLISTIMEILKGTIENKRKSKDYKINSPSLNRKKIEFRSKRMEINKDELKKFKLNQLCKKNSKFEMKRNIFSKS